MATFRWFVLIVAIILMGLPIYAVLYYNGFLPPLRKNAYHLMVEKALALIKEEDLAEYQIYSNDRIRVNLTKEYYVVFAYFDEVLLKFNGETLYRDDRYYQKRFRKQCDNLHKQQAALDEVKAYKALQEMENK